MPELTARIHESLLAPYTPENGCYGGGVGPEVLDKARVLIEASARPRKPVVLDTGCVAVTSPAILQALKAAGLITLEPPSPAEMHRFVDEAPNCRFNANEVWRRSLIKTRSLGDIPIDGMQVISVPGEADCALLVWGGDAGGRVDYVEDGFTGMQHLSPCADGHHAAALWRVAGDTLQQTDLGEEMPSIQGVIPLRDTANGDHFFLAGGLNTGGGCGGGGFTPQVLLSWHNPPDAKKRLQILPRKSMGMQAFLQQCGMPADDSHDCFHPTGDVTEPNISFIDQHWASDRKAYLDAVLSLDYAVLRSEQKFGIFPEWLAQAIDAVSKANMPVEDKRKRTAWLFRDPALLAQAMQTSASYEMQTGLVAWLPREDWRPVIKALQGKDLILDSLRTQAEGQGKPALACTLANALGRVCSKVPPATN